MSKENHRRLERDSRVELGKAVHTLIYVNVLINKAIRLCFTVILPCLKGIYNAIFTFSIVFEHNYSVSQCVLNHPIMVIIHPLHLLFSL